MITFKSPRYVGSVPQGTSGGGFLISGKYFSSLIASYMKSEKKPYSFTLFLMVGETARIFYSNNSWGPNEHCISYRVEEGKDGGCKELQLRDAKKIDLTLSLLVYAKCTNASLTLSSSIQI